MANLKSRVARIIRRTHVPVTQDDWKILADSYLDRLRDDNIDPESYRAASDALIKCLQVIDPQQAEVEYKETIEAFAAGNESGFIAHLYFLCKAKAEEPFRLRWRERERVEGVLERVREVRSYNADRKR